MTKRGGASISVREFDIDDGAHKLHCYESDVGRLPVLWFHGTPNVGQPPAPLFSTAAQLGIRFASWDRPGYGGSDRQPGRDLRSAARHAAAVADALGFERFAVLGHSGGGSHALAVASVLGERVAAAAAVCPLAPSHAEGLDYFQGMIASGQAALGAAMEGLSTKEAYERKDGANYDPEFTEADNEALSGSWAWFKAIVDAAVRTDTGGAVDDDIAYVMPWGFDVSDIICPLLIVAGEDDRIAPVAHAEWIANRVGSSTLVVRESQGHISALTHADRILEWLAERILA